MTAPVPDRPAAERECGAVSPDTLPPHPEDVPPCDFPVGHDRLTDDEGNLWDHAYRFEGQVAGWWNDTPAERECTFNPGKLCRDMALAGSGHCCREYDQYERAAAAAERVGSEREAGLSGYALEHYDGEDNHLGPCVLLADAETALAALRAHQAAEVAEREQSWGQSARALIKEHNFEVAEARAAALNDAADALVWVKPETCPCEHPDLCCGSEESCDAMQPIQRMFSEHGLRARAAREAGQPGNPDSHEWLGSER